MVGGASRGLGFAVARALAAEGASVSIASRQASSIQDAAGRLSAEFGRPTVGAAVDMRNAADLARWHEETMQRFGGVDLVFVNTGGPPAGTALSFDDAAWTNAFELLLLSAVRLVRLTVPSMKARGGGAIVVSTSSAAKEPIPNLALSNVVRASVGALSKVLSDELAADKIRVNHLIPGRFDTDRVRELDSIRGKATGASPEDVRTAFSKTIPLGRYGQADEFAAAAAFLFSDASRYITGASLQVDGGLIRSNV
jgi:3-oxoacyl-[acyl-carrier protein] reductase